VNGAVIYASVPCCPGCGSAQSVTWKGREGTTTSKDKWVCTRDGRAFTTPAR
jgi:hypothetical protein